MKYCSRRLSCSLLAISLMGLSAPANAVDLAYVIEQAQRNDPTFSAARYAFDAQKERLPQARSRLLPELSYQYQRRDTQQDIVRSENTVFARGSDQFESTSTGLRLAQSLFDWERWSRLKQSRATVSRAEAELLDARHALYLRAAEAYFGVLEQYDLLQTVSAEKSALEGHLQLAQRRAASGLGRQVDVDDAEARYLTAVAKEIEIQSALADARFALSIITGEVPDELSLLREDLDFEPPDPTSPEAWVEVGETTNPQVIARRYAVTEALQELRARRGERYPTLDLVYTDGTQETDGSLFGGGSEVDTGEISLELRVPLYQGGYKNSRIREAQSEHARANELLRETQRETEREVRDAFQRVVASIAQIEALTRSVQAQTRTLDLKSRGYNTGRYNILEVLDAEQDLSRVQQSATKARYDYALNTLRLKGAAGVLDDADIAIINAWLTAAAD